jgi:hypothetical protein
MPLSLPIHSADTLPTSSFSPPTSLGHRRVCVADEFASPTSLRRLHYGRQRLRGSEGRRSRGAKKIIIEVSTTCIGNNEGGRKHCPN